MPPRPQRRRRHPRQLRRKAPLPRQPRQRRTGPSGNESAAPLPTGTGNRPAPIAAPAPAPALVEVTVPAGTELSIELLNDLSSETATTETPVRGRLRRAVEVGRPDGAPGGRHADRAS